VNGLAADNDTNTLYWIDTNLPNSRLMKAVINGCPSVTPVFIGTVNVAGIPTGLGSLAYDTQADVLVGYKFDGTDGAGVEGFYTINTTTAEATFLAEVTDPVGYDFYGFDYDPVTDAFYAVNDLAANRGIFRINKPWTTPPTITFLAAYPVTTPAEVDVDGLAVGNGKLYLVNDNNSPPTGGGHYVFDLATMSYESDIPFTWPTAGSNSGGAWAPGFLATPTGANVGIAISAPTDCTATVGGLASYTFTLNNLGPDTADDATIIVTFPANVSYSNSTPPVVPSGNTLTVNLGTIGAGGSGFLSVDFSVNSGTSVAMSASATTSSSDICGYNNNASGSMTVLGAIPSNSTIKGVLSTINTSSTSLVPGLGGARFAGGAAATTSLLRPWRSPDGTKWIMDADTDLATTQDEVAVVGTVADGIFSVVLQEGVTTLAEGDHIGVIDDVMGINDAGQYAFSTNTDGATATDEVVVKWNGSAFVTVAREGSPTSLGGGINYGTPSDGSTIQNDGTVSFYTILAGGGVGTTDDQSYFTDDGATLLTREGVTEPTNQANGTTHTCESLQSGTTEGLGLMLNAGGADFCSVMEIITAAATEDRILVVNNDVKIQEGHVIPGSAFASPVASNSPITNTMEPNGDWYSYGSNASGDEWAVRNGMVIAATGAEVVAESGLLWTTTTLFAAAGSQTGNYVVGGSISGADVVTKNDTVLVLNGTTIIARENDPIDLNNDNLFDGEDYYIQSFIADRLFVTDSWVYVVVRLRNADDARCLSSTSNVDRGQALIRIPIGGGSPLPCCKGDLDGSANVDEGDINEFIGQLVNDVGGDPCPLSAADVNNDTVVDGLDISPFVDLILANGGDGTVCP